MDRYVCVHGHFYQPPRENPWLEMVERQDDAYPFHDWNERITAECYAPNTRARILDERGRIVAVVNNFAAMSFNLGPTLLAWLQHAAPTTYHDILDADRRSAERFGGHGSAMAQVYGHAIIPLASTRDRRTHIRWGITDFRHRFGREPEGMWLAETAVDDETLDLLAQEGIRFTVLAPHQAARVRPIGDERWQQVDGGQVDPSMPYQVTLPSGRTIAVFFYDGPISQAVAFEGLLDSAERFEHRLMHGFVDRDGPQLVSIATDGETYGHHHRHGEMALAATLERITRRDDVELTNYAQYLAMFPPTHEVEVLQASSWSCPHGVERWRSDCGCGRSAEHHQRWRAPLRTSLEQLRTELDTHFERYAHGLLVRPWQARDAYLEVVHDRDGNLERFLAQQATGPLSSTETSRVLHLLELQRHALLMDTSCGWFFDELSRLEPVQVLRYAARAIQLAEAITGVDLEPQLLAGLAAAESNDPTYGDGRTVYERLVRPSVADLDQVAAHHAVSSLVRSYSERERVGAFEIVIADRRHLEAGRARLAAGRLTVRSVVTHAEAHREFAALHLGDHNFTCGIRPWGEDASYQRMCASLEACFDIADTPGVIRAIDTHFGTRNYSLSTLFRDEQRHILDTVLATTLDEVTATYRTIYRGRAQLMRFLAEIGAELPNALRSAAEVVIDHELTDELSTSKLDLEHVTSLLDEAGRLGIQLDHDGLSHTFATTIAHVATRIAERLADGNEPFASFDEPRSELLARVDTLLEVVSLLPFEVDLAPAQDVLWSVLRDHHTPLEQRADLGEHAARQWLEQLEHLTEALGIAPPAQLETLR
ncbi:MAG: DUF3536 domain-containing protein [Nitriliruptoraceae bacterium]